MGPKQLVDAKVCECSLNVRPPLLFALGILFFGSWSGISSVAGVSIRFSSSSRSTGTSPVVSSVSSVVIGFSFVSKIISAMVSGAAGSSWAGSLWVVLGNWDWGSLQRASGAFAGNF